MVGVLNKMETGDERRRSARLAAAADETYECDAPRFFDFSTAENADPVDEWFEKTDESAVADKKARVAEKVKRVKKQYRHLAARSIKPLTIPAEFNLTKPKTVYLFILISRERLQAKVSKLPEIRILQVKLLEIKLLERKLLETKVLPTKLQKRE